MDRFLQGQTDVISRVPCHDPRPADSGFFAQIQTDIDTLPCFTPRSTEKNSFSASSVDSQLILGMGGVLGQGKGSG